MTLVSNGGFGKVPGQGGVQLSPASASAPSSGFGTSSGASASSFERALRSPGSPHEGERWERPPSSSSSRSSGSESISGEGPACCSSASSPSQFRRWRAGTGSSTKSEECEEEQPMDEEEIRRRAREWVNKTVPMESVEDEPESPKSVQKGGCDVWDSDEEGVVTRIRAEAQPEAGAGGPSNSLPFFMQVLNKQRGHC
mmetsp:Transcript_51286/g.133899  ORF Transcript_51286/g.133899 Transcript_51286/m.133899 type:complete len:198 (+) Transcript_51286:2698-3291(+)